MSKNNFPNILKIIFLFIIFFIEIALFFINAVKPYSFYLNILIIIILGVLYFVFINNEGLLKNKRYQVINCIVLGIILFIFLRGLIDPNLKINLDNFDYAYEVNSKVMYIYSNLLYINIMEGLLIIYILLCKSKKR